MPKKCQAYSAWSGTDAAADHLRPVLPEAAYLLGQEEVLLQMLKDGDMTSAFDLDEKAKPRCLQDARDAFLNHPLVLLCEAEQGQCSDPAWLRQHAVSRLLTEPHYLTPLEPPNAIGDAKANRQYELTLGLAEDCFLGARLLLNDRTGQTRITDPKRIELAKQVLVRAMKLAPENEAYRKLAAEL